MRTRFEFTGTAQPSGARVTVEGADAQVEHRRDGVFIVTVRGLRRGATELTVRASAPGHEPWSDASSGPASSPAWSASAGSSERQAIRPITRLSPATVSRCQRTSTPAPAASALPPAPISAPAEKAAWKEDRIGLSWRRSTATPCAFIATSSEPLPAPSSMAAGSSSAKLGASAGQRYGEAAQDEREARRAPAPPARRHPARDRHRHQRADRDQAERDPQFGLAEVEALLDRRDAGRPRAQQRPVEEEDDADRGARGSGARGHRPRLEAATRLPRCASAPASRS